MTSHLDSHGTTDIKPEMLSGVRTGNSNPHDKYNVHGIVHAWINRKDDIFMQGRLVRRRVELSQPDTMVLSRIAV